MGAVCLHGTIVGPACCIKHYSRLLCYLCCGLKYIVRPRWRNSRFVSDIECGHHQMPLHAILHFYSLFFAKTVVLSAAAHGTACHRMWFCIAFTTHFSECAIEDVAIFRCYRHCKAFQKKIKGLQLTTIFIID